MLLNQIDSTTGIFGDVLQVLRSIAGSCCISAGCKGAMSNICSMIKSETRREEVFMMHVYSHWASFEGVLVHIKTTQQVFPSLDQSHHFNDTNDERHMWTFGWVFFFFWLKCFVVIGSNIHTRRLCARMATPYSLPQLSMRRLAGWHLPGTSNCQYVNEIPTWDWATWDWSEICSSSTKNRCFEECLCFQVFHIFLKKPCILALIGAMCPLGGWFWSTIKGNRVEMKGTPSLIGLGTAADMGLYKPIHRNCALYFANGAL